MMPVQLSLFGEQTARDPFSCPYAESGKKVDNHILCTLDGKETWVMCRDSLAGDPPMCAWEEPDNSPEACERRLKWMHEHKSKEDKCKSTTS